MSQQLWNQVDEYFAGALHPDDPALAGVLAACQANHLPPISVAPNQGRFLHVLARICGARKILEVGTLAGYSAICMARALPAGGRLISLEIDPRHAAIARENIARANLAAVAEVRLGRAIDLLPALQSEAPFDLIFIDADKPSNADYFHWALKLSRPGTLILIDNVVREGAVVDAASGDSGVQGTRRVVAAVAAEKRVTATALQTVGSKGYDGLLLAVVNAPSSESFRAVSLPRSP
jgi:predicted O-methyltransferase YrrM